MHRVLVVGVTGAGKSTAARRIAERIGAPFHEMDALAIGPAWSRRPELVGDVERIVAEPSWVVDSHGYDDVRTLMWAAVDTVVWLDYPRRTVLPRVVRRSLARSWSRRDVFGGNRETWRGWLSRDHPVWWSLATFRGRRTLLAELTAAPAAAADVRTVRLRSPAEFERWFAAAG